MKKFLYVFAMFFVVIPLVQAENNLDNDRFNKSLSFVRRFEADLHDFKAYQAKENTNDITGFSLNRPINSKYIKAYEEIVEQKYDINNPINPWLAVYYDPQYFMKYLEQIPTRTLEQNYQLLILWQIYKPQMIDSEDYKAIAMAAHNKTLNYLADDNNWQASWRQKEYAETVQEDFQKCYADKKCLIKAIPYWMDLQIPMSVVLPCDLAKEHNLIYYFDSAAGGSGTRALMTSTCYLDDKYNFDPELDTYISNVLREETPYSSGTMIHFFNAVAHATYMDIKYQPDFNADKIADWRDFPYTEWAVQSYYNFKKFNEVLQHGIGYKRAVELLTEHYIKSFDTKPEAALNTALITLNPPTSKLFKRITPSNLNYLLLSGASWKEIEKHLPENFDPASVLEQSIAYPQNLRQLIKLKDNINVDHLNEFGKTPLQTAAQYGFLESVKILHNAGADINHQTNDSTCWGGRFYDCIHNGKRSALMYALQENHFEVAQYLLDNGADITLTDSLENTAYDYLMKSAPKLSTYKSMGIYGGAAFNRVEEDEQYLPPEQYAQLGKRLKTDQYMHIIDVLSGEWQQEAWYGDQPLLKETVLFEKYYDPQGIMLIISDGYGTKAACLPDKNFYHAFLCQFQTLSDENKEITDQFFGHVIFQIAHYYSDQLKIIGIREDEFKQCFKDATCKLEVLATLSRERDK